MSEEDSALSQIRSVKTADGRTISLTCPVCGESTFYTSGPKNEADRKGFRHVIVGISGEEEMLYNPVKFMFCENCGFIMKFMIPTEDGGE